MDSFESQIPGLVLRQKVAPRAAVLEGEILGETPEGQIRLLREILEALTVATPLTTDPMRDLAAGLLRGMLHGAEQHQLADQASTLLGPPLPYTAVDLQRMLEILVDGGIRASFAVPLLTRLVRHVERYATGNGLPGVLRPILERERDKLRPFTGANEYGRLLVRVGRLLEPQDSGIPEPCEPWAAAMLADMQKMDADASAGWRRLLAHGATIEQTRPSAKWLRAAVELTEGIGWPLFQEQVLLWLVAVAEPSQVVISERNSAVVKGLAWTCGTHDAPALADVLAKLAESLLRWPPKPMDWRGLKAGNACLNALGAMPGNQPLVHLAQLSLRLKGRQLQTSVGRAIEAATVRRGLPREDVEELTIPTLGLECDGCLRVEIGEARVEIRVDSGGDPKLRWLVAGEEQQSPPASVRSANAAELRALQGTVKEMRKSLAAQRERLQSLFMVDRSWNLHEWRARYLDHPLLQPMVCGLIWRIELRSGDSTLAMPRDQDLIDLDGRPLSGLTGHETVRLWHPLSTEPAVVERWRQRLEDQGIQQPFKQVQREVYVIGPNEIAANVSARYAGRVLRQQVMIALCRERSWLYAVQGPWHGAVPCITRVLPQRRIRAELSVAPVAGGQSELSRVGFYPYVLTDVLRFRGLDGAACQLTEVPAQVSSEVLRDVDFFVTVAGPERASGSTGDAPPAERKRPATRTMKHRRLNAAG